VSNIATTRAAASPLARSINWQSAGRALALVAAGSWAGYFLFTGMPQLTLDVYPRTVTLHILVGALAVAYFAWLIVARRLPGGTPLDLPVLAFIGAYALATAFSVNWRVSLEATLQIGAAIIVFYALAELPGLSALQLTRAFMLLGAALALYALWMVGNDYGDYLRLTRSVEGLRVGNIFPPTVPRVHDVSDHTNVLAMLLVLAAPFLALTAVRGRTLVERVVAAAALLVAAMALFLTLSRGGWVGAVVGIAFTLAGTWATLRIAERERAGERIDWRAMLPAGISPTAIAAVAGAIALAAFGTLAFLARSSTRPGWLFRGSLSPREDAWKAGWHIFRDNISHGGGPDSFALLYNQYSGRFLVYTQHAHNGFLQVADDAGLIGLAALAALVAAAAYMLWRTWREGEVEQRLLAVASTGALIGYAVHNTVDAGNIWKATGIALAILGAIIARNYAERGPDAGDTVASGARSRLDLRRAIAWVPRVVLLALLFVPLLLWYRIDVAHHDYWIAMEAFNDRGDPSQPGARAVALRHMQSAVDEDSSMAVYQLQLGQMQATTYVEGGQRDEDRFLAEAAVVHLQRAVALDPGSDLAHADLARAYQLAGRRDDAAAEAAKTRYIARNHVQPVLLAGEVYEDLGRMSDAIATYGQAISIDAGLADAEYWQMSPFRRQHFAEILDRSALGINPCTHGAYLVEARRYDAATALDGLGADADGCRLLVFSSPNDLVLRVALAKIRAQQGKMSEARGQLDAAASRQPDFGPARTELGRWFAAEGQLAEARHQWVLGGQLGEAESLLLLGQSYPQGQVPAGVASQLRALVGAGGAQQQQDLISILYYRMKYGRISPYSPMIAGDWQKAEPRLYAQVRQALAVWQPDAEPLPSP
jgi:O-antigen ligase